jgi:hypothetical protein
MHDLRNSGVKVFTRKRPWKKLFTAMLFYPNGRGKRLRTVPVWVQIPGEAQTMKTKMVVRKTVKSVTNTHPGIGKFG